MHVDNRELFLSTLIILHYNNTKNCSKRIIDLKNIAKRMSIITAGFMLSPLSPLPSIHPTHITFISAWLRWFLPCIFDSSFSPTRALLFCLYSGNTSYLLWSLSSFTPFILRKCPYLRPLPLPWSTPHPPLFQYRLTLAYVSQL